MTTAMRFDVGANDSASPVFLRVAAAAEKLRDQLKQLDRMRINPTITLGMPSSAELAQLASVKTALDQIDGRNARAKVQVTGVPTAALAIRLRAVAAALRDIDGVNAAASVGVTGTIPNPAELNRAARALRQLRDVGTILINIRITGDTDALARIAALRAALGGIPSSTSTTVNVDVDRSLSGRLAEIGKTLAKFGALGGAAAVGLGSATAATATLAGSLTSLAGLAPLLVGGLAAAGLAAATLKVGLSGVGDALKETDPTKFAEALKGLAPSAAQFATAVRGMQGAFDKLQLDVQQKLFAGLGESFKQLGNTYLPVLKSGMGGIATQFNLLGKEMVSFATSAGTVRDVDTIFRNTAIALQNARPAAVNLAAAFRDIAVVGTGMLPELASGLTQATARFRDFIAEARATGQLQQWIQGGIDTLNTLGNIAGNVGSVLGSVFTAAKASGADFLSTIDRITAELADLLKSSQGQTALITFFAEARAAVDALMPGLRAVAAAALDMIQAFSQTGALQNLARNLSDIGVAVAPLGKMLGQLAGETLNALTNGAQVLIGALSPLVSVVTGVVGALGPLPALVLASVVAFKALSAAAIAAGFAAIGASVAALAPLISTYVAGLTGSLAAGSLAAAAATRLGTALAGLGKALPLIAVGVIAIGAAYAEFGPKADEAAQKVVNGSLSIRQAIEEEAAQIHKNQIEWLGGMNAQESYAAASKNVRAELDQQIATLGPMAKLQAEVAMAQADLNDAVAEYGPSSSQAAGAAGRLSSANNALKAAQDGAAKAAMSHTDAIKAQADEMNSQIGTALAYEGAVRRTAEAHTEAAAALKKGGANSVEYKAAVSDLTRSIAAQADAARSQAEALGGTEAGVRAYNTEIMKAADMSTQAGRDAFGKLASSLDNTGLAALSAAAKMTGLRTEVMTLPDGRTVTVVVAADQSKLDTVKQTVEDFTSREYIGKITIVGDPKPVGDVFKQQLTLINGTTAMMTLDANGAPLEVKVGQSKYKIDQTTGVMTIDGNVGPGESNLSGLKVKVDATTGVMTIDGDPTKANTKTETAVTFANGKTGIITIDGEPALANGKITAAVKLADGSTGTITVDANQTPANGKITATIRYADGSTGTVTINAKDLATPVIDRLKQPTSSTHTIRVIQTQVGPEYRSGGTTVLGAHGMIVQPMAAGGVVGMAGGGRLSPMSGRIAKVVPPNTWRVIGDRVTDDEAFIPINNSARSMAILQATANRMGVPLSPQAAGSSVSTAWSRPLPSMATNSGGIAARQLLATNALRKDIQDLAKFLRDAPRGDIQMTVEDRSGDPVATARAAQLALRVAR